MTSYIAIRREAYTEAREEVKKVTPTMVRRPLLGVTPKRDEFAFLRVINEAGKEIELLNAGNMDGRTAYANFIVQQVQRGEAEKSQVVQTFGETFVHFYDQSPTSLQMAGMLFNTVDFDWKREWWENYNKYLRGTRLVELNARLYLCAADYVYEGYLLSSSTVDIADQPHAVQFNATMLLTDIMPIRVFGGLTVLEPDPRARASLSPLVGVTHPDEYLNSSGYYINPHQETIDNLIEEEDVEANIDEFLSGSGVEEAARAEAIMNEGINEVAPENILMTDTS